MANNIRYRNGETAKTLYATLRSEAGLMWNGSSLETMTTANWANYDVGLTESPASSYLYEAAWPAGLTTVGWYWIDFFQQIGASPAINDPNLDTYVKYWNGTVLRLPAVDVVQLNGTIQSAGKDLGNLVSGGGIIG